MGKAETVMFLIEEAGIDIDKIEGHCYKANIDPDKLAKSIHEKIKASVTYLKKRGMALLPLSEIDLVIKADLLSYLKAVRKLEEEVQ